MEDLKYSELDQESKQNMKKLLVTKYKDIVKNRPIKEYHFLPNGKAKGILTRAEAKRLCFRIELIFVIINREKGYYLLVDDFTALKMDLLSDKEWETIDIPCGEAEFDQQLEDAFEEKLIESIEELIDVVME